VVEENEENNKLSEENTKLYEENAKLSEENTKLFKENTKLSEDNAKLSEDNAKLSEGKIIERIQDKERSQELKREITSCVDELFDLLDSLSVFMHVSMTSPVALNGTFVCSP
jgi:cell division protein FtsB